MVTFKAQAFSGCYGCFYRNVRNTGKALVVSGDGVGDWGLRRTAAQGEMKPRPRLMAFGVLLEG